MTTFFTKNNGNHGNHGDDRHLTFFSENQVIFHLKIRKLMIWDSKIHLM